VEESANPGTSGHLAIFENRVLKKSMMNFERMI
jgi:hypothetical protein